MDTVNLVLMIILVAALSFSVGDAYGRAVMRKTISQAMNNFIEGIKKANAKKEE